MLGAFVLALLISQATAVGVRGAQSALDTPTTPKPLELDNQTAEGVGRADSAPDIPTTPKPLASEDEVAATVIGALANSDIPTTPKPLASDTEIAAGALGAQETLDIPKGRKPKASDLLKAAFKGWLASRNEDHVANVEQAMADAFKEAKSAVLDMKLEDVNATRDLEAAAVMLSILAGQAKNVLMVANYSSEADVFLRNMLPYLHDISVNSTGIREWYLAKMEEKAFMMGENWRATAGRYLKWQMLDLYKKATGINGTGLNVTALNIPGLNGTKAEEASEAYRETMLDLFENSTGINVADLEAEIKEGERNVAEEARQHEMMRREYQALADNFPVVEGVLTLPNETETFLKQYVLPLTANMSKVSRQVSEAYSVVVHDAYQNVLIAGQKWTTADDGIKGAPHDKGDEQNGAASVHGLLGVFFALSVGALGLMA